MRCSSTLVLCFTCLFLCAVGLAAQSDREVEAMKLRNDGEVLFQQGTAESLRQALGKFDKAAKLYRALWKRADEAYCLFASGRIYDLTGEKDKALDYLQQALSLYRAARDQSGEAETLISMGTTYADMGEHDKGLKHYEQALELFRSVKNEIGEAKALNNIGTIYSEMWEKGKALGYYQQALQIRHKVKDRPGEAASLTNIGRIYASLGTQEKAIEYYQKALPIYREVKDRLGEAAVLGNLGGFYLEQSEHAKALEYFEMALSLLRTAGDRRGEAIALINMGGVYIFLGDKQKALEYMQQALPVFRGMGDKISEASALNNIGGVYADQDENDKALEYYQRALTIFRSLRNPRGEAWSLNGIGYVYAASGKPRKALEYCHQALPIYRAVGDRSGEASTLNNIGAAYNLSGEETKATEYYQQALPILRAVGSQLQEAKVLSNLIVTSKNSNPRLAIFYGKQSAKLLQKLRTNIRELEREFQRSFLKSVEGIYRELAELLAGQGRLSEVHQLLNLVKDQEYFDFTSRQGKQVNRPIRELAMTPLEATADQQYQQANEKVAFLGQQYAELQIKLIPRKPTETEEQQLTKLDAELKIASDEMLTLFKQLDTEFGNSTSEKNRLEWVEDTTEMQEALKELYKRTGVKAVAIYTLVHSEKIRILLITHDDIVTSQPQIIKSTDTDQKVQDLLSALQNPSVDPSLLAKGFYDILLKQIEPELQKSGAQALMWSLDQSLRYLPMGVLYDGQKYLVERFNNVVFTRANKARMTAEVSSNWIGLGFGSSKKQVVQVAGKQVTFPTLLGINQELDSIFGHSRGLSGGVMSGTVWRNEGFTKVALLKALGEQRRPLVHIASHFRFQPGDETASFLLMGDGEIMTLAEMQETSDDLFRGVELLTLSACSTGAQMPDANGREVDGFAELAQRKGAGAVLASLWAVADQSTARLMAEFYQARQSKQGMTKAEALRQAQLKLLRGKIDKADGANCSQRTSELVGEGTNQGQPKFKCDPRAPHAHPYFWAPFILIGNWR